MARGSSKLRKECLWTRTKMMPNSDSLGRGDAVEALLDIQFSSWKPFVSVQGFKKIVVQDLVSFATPQCRWPPRKKPRGTNCQATRPSSAMQRTFQPAKELTSQKPASNPHQVWGPKRSQPGANWTRPTGRHVGQKLAKASKETARQQPPLMRSPPISTWRFVFLLRGQIPQRTARKTSITIEASQKTYWTHGSRSSAEGCTKGFRNPFTNKSGWEQSPATGVRSLPKGGPKSRNAGQIRRSGLWFSLACTRFFEVLLCFI